MRYRAGANSVKGASLILALSCTAALAGELPGLSGDPAHTLAQKFAGDPPTAAAREATPTKKILAEAPPKPVPAATEPRAKIGPQRPSLEYEMEMLRRARAEDADRKTNASPATTDVKTATPSVKPARNPAQSASEGLAAAALVVEAAVNEPATTTASPLTTTKVAAPATSEPMAATPTATKTVLPFATTTVSPPTFAPPALQKVDMKPDAATGAVKVATQPAAMPNAPTDTPKVIGVRPTAAVVAPEAAPLSTSAIAVPQAIAAQPAAISLPMIAPPPAVTTPPVMPAQLADAKPAALAPVKPSTGPTSQATILLILEPQGQATPPATPAHDALVCTGETCVVSNGFEAPAKALSRSDAQALKSSDGVTPDSCRGKSACVFREVAVSPTPRIGVLDLIQASGNAGGDGYTTDIDTSCRVADGELMCDHPLATPDFRMWVVPEAIAKTAGATLLENAIVEGLPQSDVVSSTDK